jgi:hypothetical protein
MAWAGFRCAARPPLAGGGAIVSLTDKREPGRLGKMDDWLEHLLQRLLEQQRERAWPDRSLVDG